MRATQIPFVAFAVLANLPLPAQAPAPTQPAPRAAAMPREVLDALRAPIHRELGADGVDRGTWTAGRDWSARLQDGIAFLPVQQPDRLAAPWQWRTAAVRVAGRPLELRAPDLRVVDDWRAQYDLGGVVETYDVRPEGVEQTFVLTTPVAGDVAIDGAITTELVAGTRPGRHGPIEFRAADGSNGVRYGAAFAVDARGQRLPLRTSWDGERITIDVPGDWLAGAAWPVVVDPLLSAVLMQTNPTQAVSAVAIERDERNASRPIAYAIERANGTLSRDLFFLLADDDLQGAVTVFSRLGYGARSNPQVAFVTGSNKWVFAWEEIDPGISQTRGAYHLHDGGSATATNGFQWAPNSGNRRQRNVRVGGNRTAGPEASALFVWESEPVATTGNTSATQVWCCTLDTANGTAGAPVLLGGNNANFPGDCEAPSVSRDRGLGSWIVAWQHQTGFPSRWDAVAQRVSVGGSVAAGIFHPDTTGTVNQLAPVVDGQHGRYLMTFQTVPIGSLTSSTQWGHAVRAQAFRWSEGSAFPVADGPSQTMQGPATYPAFHVDAVAYDKVTGCHWGVSTSQSFLGVPITGMNVLGYDAKPRENLYLANADSVGTGIAFDVDAHQFVVGWGDRQNGAERANAVRFAYPARQQSHYGSGCTSAVQTGLGTFLAGDEDQVLRLTGAPSGVIALLAVASSPTNVTLPAPALSGCSLLVDMVSAPIGTVALLTNALGRAEVPLSLPSNLADVDLHVQWLHFDGSGTTLLATDGLRLQIR